MSMFRFQERTVWQRSMEMGIELDDKKFFATTTCQPLLLKLESLCRMIESFRKTLVSPAQ